MSFSAMADAKRARLDSEIISFDRRTEGFTTYSDTTYNPTPYACVGLYKNVPIHMARWDKKHSGEC